MARCSLRPVRLLGMQSKLLDVVFATTRPQGCHCRPAANRPTATIHTDIVCSTRPGSVIPIPNRYRDIFKYRKIPNTDTVLKFGHRSSSIVCAATRPLFDGRCTLIISLFVRNHIVEKRRIVSGEFWRQTYMDNGVGADREKDGSTS